MYIFFKLTNYYKIRSIFKIIHNVFNNLLFYNYSMIVSADKNKYIQI